MSALPAILGAWRQCDRLIVPVPMTPMQKKSTSYLGAFSQPGATLDADASWAMAAALCSPVETVFDLQLRISSPCIPHARECLCCTLLRRSARQSAAGADTSRGSAALIGVQTKRHSTHSFVTTQAASGKNMQRVMASERLLQHRSIGVRALAGAGNVKQCLMSRIASFRHVSSPGSCLCLFPGLRRS